MLKGIPVRINNDESSHKVNLLLVQKKLSSENVQYKVEVEPWLRTSFFGDLSHGSRPINYWIWTTVLTPQKWGPEPWLNTHQLLNLSHGLTSHFSMPWAMTQTFWLFSKLTKANLSKTCLARSGYPIGSNVIFLGGLSHGSDIFLCVLRHDSKFIFLGVLSHGSESFLSHGSDPPQNGAPSHIGEYSATKFYFFPTCENSLKKFPPFFW